MQECMKKHPELYDDNEDPTAVEEDGEGSGGKARDLDEGANSTSTTVATTRPTEAVTAASTSTNS